MLTSYKSLLAIAVSIALAMASCERFYEIDERLYKIENKIGNLESQMQQLQAAYDAGKIITAVTPISEAPGGWTITFSDGSEIVVSNGNDATVNVAPYLKVGNDGIWTVSYDNGNTFTQVRLPGGGVVVATGVNAKYLRAVPGQDGFYHLQTYLESDPETTLNDIPTTQKADASKQVSYMVNDNQNNTVTFVTSDGAMFRFSSQQSIPASIVLLSSEPVLLTPGYQASIEFRVNPSSASFCIAGKDSQVQLDKISNVQTKSSYVTDPDFYSLVSVEQVYDDYTLQLKEGQYRAVIRDNGKRTEYHQTAALVLNVNQNIQLSSPIFEIICTEGGPLHTGLPVVTINTSAPITSKEDWVENASMKIQNADNTTDYEGTISIKGRGNSTWGFPKKPYAVKLNKKSKILGMPTHKRWVLLANWMDRTLIRNAVAFEISRHTGLEWTPRGQFVEVVLNGKHVGNYYLCEQIKVDPNRVNVSEDGGQIMEVDVAYDEAFKFRAVKSNFPWMFKDPDEVSEEQFNSIRDYVNNFEEAFYDKTRFQAFEYADYLDLESTADWFIVNELAMNWELGHPKSCYFNKDVGGKLKAGPVWDFDWGTYNPDNTKCFCSTVGLYYGPLMSDSRFKAVLKKRWQAAKPALEYEIPLYIDSLKEYLRKSDYTNQKLWPLDKQHTNGDEQLTFDQSIERLKRAYLDKLSWMDSKIGKY